jgi:hypothetical protein
MSRCTSVQEWAHVHLRSTFVGSGGHQLFASWHLPGGSGREVRPARKLCVGHPAGTPWVKTFPQFIRHRYISLNCFNSSLNELPTSLQISSLASLQKCCLLTVLRLFLFVTPFCDWAEWYYTCKPDHYHQVTLSSLVSKCVKFRGRQQH